MRPADIEKRRGVVEPPTDPESLGNGAGPTGVAIDDADQVDVRQACEGPDVSFSERACADHADSYRCGHQCESDSLPEASRRGRPRGY